MTGRAFPRAPFSFSSLQKPDVLLSIPSNASVEGRPDPPRLRRRYIGLLLQHTACIGFSDDQIYVFFQEKSVMRESFRSFRHRFYVAFMISVQLLQ